MKVHDSSFDNAIQVPDLGPSNDGIYIENLTSDRLFVVYRVYFGYKFAGQQNHSVTLMDESRNHRINPQQTVAVDSAERLVAAIRAAGAEAVLAEATSDDCKVIYTVYYWPEDELVPGGTRNPCLRLVLGIGGLLRTLPRTQSTVRVIDWKQVRDDL